MKTHVGRILAVSAVAVGTLMAATPAAAAGSAIVPLPWSLTWLDGKASGSYTIVQQPLGIGRNVTVSGTVSSSSGECYYVRLTTGGVNADSPSACGPAPVSFTLKQTAFLAAAPTVRLCRTVTPGCGPTTPLSVLPG